MREKTVVINVVGLTNGLISADRTPFLFQFVENGCLKKIKPVLPAVTCSAQATYLTGAYPSEHGIVGNGWYFEEECEVKFWRQSNKLIKAKKIWETAKELDKEFTCANLFWWYNMYSSSDYSVTPRPNYLADGRKIPDVYSHPADLRNDLQKKLGAFPLFNFWGPTTSIKSSKWIADAAIFTDKKYNPTLSLIYLPHLDYGLQKYGNVDPRINKDLKEIDKICKQLHDFYSHRGAKVVFLSEYGITDVNNPVSLNRVFRQRGWLAIREERGLELLDAGASQVFAVADHQVAHVYVKDKKMIDAVRKILEETHGVDKVIGVNERDQYHLNHKRSGDFVVFANSHSWFTYYYWLDDKRAPDFARTVDIHRKPGYDPAEMFFDPKKSLIKLKLVGKLLKKKIGFRTLMDFVPLDSSIIKGSHGRVPENDQFYPVIISKELDKKLPGHIESIEVHDLILSHIFKKYREKQDRKILGSYSIN